MMLYFRNICTVLLCLLLTAWGKAQGSLPDTVTRNGYTFVKSWTNPMDQLETGWSLANWTFNNNLCEFRPENASFENGKLKLSLSHKNGDAGSAPDKDFWGAEMFSHDPEKFGRIVTRMKPNAPSGVIASFFLINIVKDNNGNITDHYEIDIEFVGSTDQVQFALHWRDENGHQYSTHESVDLPFDASAAYHQWAIEWTGDYIAYYVDDSLLHTFDNKFIVEEQAHPQTINMNYWISSSEQWAGSFDSTGLPHTTAYDYVTYYSLAATPAAVPEGQGKTAPAVNPNPFEERLHVSGERWRHAGYRLYNAQGVVVDRGKLYRGKLEVPDTLPRGYYQLVLNGQQGVVRKKLIKR